MTSSTDFLSNLVYVPAMQNPEWLLAALIKSEAEGEELIRLNLRPIDLAWIIDNLPDLNDTIGVAPVILATAVVYQRFNHIARFANYSEHGFEEDIWDPIVEFLVALGMVDIDEEDECGNPKLNWPASAHARLKIARRLAEFRRNFVTTSPASRPEAKPAGRRIVGTI